jgi:adenylate kinase
VELALGENASKYRGYVLDGYPRSRDEAKALFIEEVPAPEPAEGEEAQPPTERAKREPRVVYALGFPPSEEHGELELLVERCHARPAEDPALVEGHNDEAGLTRRHGAQSDKAVEFFKETCADRVVALDAAQALEAVYKQAALDLLGRDLPFNYLDEVDFEERKESTEVEPVEEGELSPEAIEQQKKEEEEQKKLQEVIERERELLVKQSGPLRTYLMQVVVPHIQKALMEVCHLQPEDPVDYLAEYLFHAAVAEQELGELPKAWRENPWVEPVQKDR